MIDVEHIRAAVTAYHRTRELLPSAQYPSIVQASIDGLIQQIEAVCQEVSGLSHPGRWAHAVVGPVLAAGMGATVDMRETRGGPDGVLRAFGLAGERSVSAYDAWRLVQPYAHRKSIAADALACIARSSGVRLRGLPPSPTPVEVLMELTRPRSLPFLSRMGRWVAQYFRDTKGGENARYFELYSKGMEGLRRLNGSMELSASFGARVAAGRTFTKEDWGDLVCGRLPASRLEERVSFSVTRSFLIEYYERCVGNEKKHAPV